MPELIDPERSIRRPAGWVQGPLRILLICCNADFGVSLTRALAELSGGMADGMTGDTFTVEQVFDFAAAEAQLSRTVRTAADGQPADIVLFDLDLPDTSGLDAAALVVQAARGIPVVVLAKAGNEGQAWETIRHGTQGVVPRDCVSVDTMATVLLNAVGQRRLCEDLEQHVYALKLSNGRFLSLVENNADAIIVVDRLGVIRFANPSAEALMMCPAADLMGQMFGIPIEGSDTTEIDLRTPMGHSRAAEVRVMHTLWEGERAFIVTLRDITERKKAERALVVAKQTAEQASALKSQFLANMSHELRTPLNAIIGFSEMMLAGIAGPVEPPSYRNYIKDIHNGGEHLLSMINDLLDLSKVEGEKIDLIAVNFDLVAVTEQEVGLLLGEAERKDIALTITQERPTGWVFADEKMLRQVLLNLVGNAIKFTPQGGSVAVAVNRTYRGEARIVVRDTGVGIPTDQIPRAFAAFVQIENAFMREENAGAGLGLALCRHYVELHQGRITLDSTVDVGTTVTVVLPRHRTLALPAETGGVVPLTPGAAQGHQKVSRR